jgi:hypothetical protein
MCEIKRGKRIRLLAKPLKLGRRVTGKRGERRKERRKGYQSFDPREKVEPAANY